MSPIPQLRAYHASEIPLVFGTYNATTTTNVPPSSVEIALSKTMQQAWVAFARNPANGLLSMGWPAYNGSEQAIIATLGNYKNQTGWAFTESLVTDALCPNITFFEGIFDDVETLLESL